MGQEWRLYLSLLFVTVVAVSNGQLTADFHLRGVTGSASFQVSGTNVNVVLQLSEALGVSRVSLRPIWVNYDLQDACAESALGAAVSPTQVILGATTANINLVLPVADISLEGLSFVIEGAQKTICATIQRSTGHITAMAMFKDTIFGTVYFRQADDPGAPTVIVSDLYTSGNVRQAKWAISEDMAPCGGTYSSQYTFNPENADGTGCSTSMHSGCPVGDLGSKLGSAQLGATSHEQRVSFKDTNLPLSGGNSVRDKVLVIYSENDNSVLACSMIKPFTGRVASVRFSEQGVAGSITFSQNSPLDATQTIVSLNGLAMNAKGYHVHKWPRPIQVQPGQSMCSGDVVSGHLNPYGIDTKNNYPPPTTSTDDMYEVGDLSSKYGTFAGQSSVSGTYIDWNLPLYGRNGIVGRSVVIHRDDPAGSRWICANIEPHEEVVAAVATFKYPVIGHAVFVQAANDPSADTSISLQLDYNDGRPGSLGHRWRINANPPGDDFLSENVADRCASTGSTYNPGNLWQQLTEGQYSPYCNRMNQLSCKEGDLYPRLGEINIRTNEGISTKYFFTDSNTALSGQNSIIGKSLVIMSADGSVILSCAEIMPLRAPKLVARLQGGAVTGSITFQQKPGVGARSTIVSNRLTGLTADHRLKILTLPPTDDGNPCSNIGGLFNPLAVVRNQASPMTDMDFEIGHISTPRTDWTDSNLQLTGVTSILGRSLAVYNGANIESCAKIEVHYYPGEAKPVSAVVTFTGRVQGTAHLSQTIFEDGTMSDTSIVLNFVNSDGAWTPRHNWHVHVSPIYGDANAVDKPCASALGHFDPYRAFANEMNYKEECKRTNPLRCEVGDQAKKVGVYDVGGGRNAYTDIDLPLTGKFSVQGRSLVLHVRDQGAPRQACGDIIPITDDAVPLEFSASANLDKRAAARVYAAAISADPSDIVVEVIGQVAGVTKARVHFTGLQRMVLRTRFIEFISNEENRDLLGAYAPHINSGNPGMTTLTYTLLLLLAAVHLMLYQRL